MQSQSKQNASSKGSRSKSDSTRINLTISPRLLQHLDEAADKDYTTRSEIIRQALLWYLRPQGRDLDQQDPEVILKVLKQRHAKAQFNKWAKQPDIDVYDG